MRPPAGVLTSIDTTDGDEEERAMYHDQRMDQVGHPGGAQEPTPPTRSRTVTTITRRSRFRAPRHSIAELDDHLLADIGLTRDDANAIALLFGNR